jgi:hypothetical protein
LLADEISLPFLLLDAKALFLVLEFSLMPALPLLELGF